MYGFNPQQAATYGNYGAVQPPPPPPNPPQAGYVGQPIPTTTNYGTAQFGYPTAASAYAQYGASASQQAASNMAGYGQQPQQEYSTDYSMYKNPTGPPAGNKFGAVGAIGLPSGGNVSSVNAIPIGSGKNTMQNHYAGYEAAVFAAASSYMQAKNTGSTNKWMTGNKATKYQGSGSNTQNKKRFGLGHQNRGEMQQQFYCEVCKISCAGNQTYKEHLEGKSHKKKEAMSKGENIQNLPRNKVSFKCDVCNVTCTGRDTYDAHVKGVKHQKTIAVMKKMNLPIPTLEPTLIPPKDSPAGAQMSAFGAPAPMKKIVGVTGTRFVGGSKLSSTGVEINDSVLEQALLLESNVKPVGEEFVEEQRDHTGKLIQYICKLCDCKFGDPNAKDLHLKGKRHRIQYKTKINPELQLEFKPSGNQWKKRGLKDANYFGQPQQMYRTPGRGIQQPRPLFQMPPVGHSVESSDDRHVVAKNAEVSPSKTDLEGIEKIVGMVEKTLKNISDQFAEDAKNEAKSQSKGEAISEDPTVVKQEQVGAVANNEEPERLLKGVMRVGLLAKNLLLKSDCEVDLVVLCSSLPTETLLKKIVFLFPKHSEKEEDETLKITENIPEACFLVNYAEIPITCRITLTCVAVRELLIPADGAAPATDKPTMDALPVLPCLAALAELRHTKFFQVKCAPLHSMNIALRIVRDISRRVKTWAPLSEWSMELLTEKTLQSLQIPLSPGDAVRRVFEVIAGGVILNKNSALLDPCEKEIVDVLKSLTDQEREDITSSAQHALRLISFNQIYKILSIDRLPDKANIPLNGLNGGVKRARESNGIGGF